MATLGLFCSPARLGIAGDWYRGSELVPMGQKDAVSLEEPVSWH